MKIQYTKETLVEARRNEATLIAVGRRKVGRNPRHDEEVTIGGPADDESEPVVEAVLMWLIKRDQASLQKLKKAVLAL